MDGRGRNEVWSQSREGSHKKFRVNGLPPIDPSGPLIATFREGQVRGDDDAGVLVYLRQQMEPHGPARLRERQIA